MSEYYRYFHPSDVRELLVSLRGKDRIRMTYAIKQADVEIAHTLALYYAHVRTVKPQLEKVIVDRTTAVNSLGDSIYDLMRGLSQEIEPIMAPFKVGSIYQGGKAYFNAGATTSQLLQQAEWNVELDTKRKLENALRDYKDTLTEGRLRVELALSEEEKAAVVEMLNTVKALPETTGR